MNDLQRVYYQESHGYTGHIKLEIYLSAGRDLNEIDKNNIADCGNLLHKKISNESYRINPKYINDAEEKRDELLNIFGNKVIYAREITNEYTGDVHSPWFMVTTLVGHIKIGWRKSVIHIDWKDTDVETKAKDLFPNESVTKEDTYIHAWDYAKATEYINTILNYGK